MCSAFLRFLLSEGSDVVDFCLIGGKASLAASLDYAISKGPAWLGEMFGTGIGGNQLARRIFKITNPNRKRPGPVAISVNKNIVTADQIQIFWEGKQVVEHDQLYSMLLAVEEQGVEGQRDMAHKLTVVKEIANM